MQILADGFPVAADDPFRVLHFTISDWSSQAWEIERKKQDASVTDAHSHIRKLPPLERIDILHACYARLRWLSGLKAPGSFDEGDRRLHQCGFLGGLIEDAYAAKLHIESDSVLIGIVRDAVPVCYNGAAVLGPLKIIRDYIQCNTWTQPIADSLRGYGSLLEGHTCGSCRDARFEIKMFLWLDEWVQIDPLRTWAELLRAQYRRLPDGERTVWRRIFAAFRPRILRRPSKAWFKHMRAGVGALGVERFTTSLSHWLQPLAASPPCKVGPLDSNLLRNLLWCCTLYPSPTLDSAIAPLAAVRWKKKTGMEKGLDPIEQYMSARPPEISLPVLGSLRDQRASRPAPKTPAQMAEDYRRQGEKRLLALIDPDGQHVRRIGGIFEIDGGLTQYSFEPATGRITDRNSGIELEFDWTDSGEFLRSQIESALRSELWASVVAALLQEEASGVRLRPKQLIIQ